MEAARVPGAASEAAEATAVAAAAAFRALLFIIPRPPPPPPPPPPAVAVGRVGGWAGGRPHLYTSVKMYTSGRRLLSTPRAECTHRFATCGDTCGRAARAGKAHPPAAAEKGRFSKSKKTLH